MCQTIVPLVTENDVLVPIVLMLLRQKLVFHLPRIVPTVLCAPTRMQ